MTRAARLLSLAALAALLLGGCASRRTVAPPGPQPPAPPAGQEAGSESAAGSVVHVVRRGETLWRIARTYGVPLDELARANGIDDPSRIEVGQRLIVPGATRVLEVPPAPAPPAPDRRQVAGAWIWPADGPVTSAFGARRSGHRHTGIDIDARPGDPVLAARAGRVVFAGRRSGYGRLVILDHGGGVASWYAHLDEIHVEPGDRVRAGQRLGRAGRSGNARGVHLHFEIRRRGRPIDPLTLLPAS
ncbi:MAG: amidase activator ActS [Acidobacteriota bacterium]